METKCSDKHLDPMTVVSYDDEYSGLCTASEVFKIVKSRMVGCAGRVVRTNGH